MERAIASIKTPRGLFDYRLVTELTTITPASDNSVEPGGLHFGMPSPLFLRRAFETHQVIGFVMELAPIVDSASGIPVHSRKTCL